MDWRRKKEDTHRAVAYNRCLDLRQALKHMLESDFYLTEMLVEKAYQIDEMLETFAEELYKKGDNE